MAVVKPTRTFNPMNTLQVSLELSSLAPTPWTLGPNWKVRDANNVLVSSAEPNPCLSNNALFLEHSPVLVRGLVNQIDLLEKYVCELEDYIRKLGTGP